jgi:hypothetical protein
METLVTAGLETGETTALERGAPDARSGDRLYNRAGAWRYM